MAGCHLDDHCGVALHDCCHGVHGMNLTMLRALSSADLLQAELASMAPTAGGKHIGSIYSQINSEADLNQDSITGQELQVAHFSRTCINPCQVSEFAPQSIQQEASYIVGWFAFFSWVATIPACAQFITGMIQAVILIFHPSANVTSLWQTTLIIFAILMLVSSDPKSTQISQRASFNVGGKNELFSSSLLKSFADQIRFAHRLSASTSFLQNICHSLRAQWYVDKACSQELSSMPYYFVTDMIKSSFSTSWPFLSSFSCWLSCPSIFRPRKYLRKATTEVAGALSGWPRSLALPVPSGASSAPTLERTWYARISQAHVDLNTLTSV